MSDTTNEDLQQTEMLEETEKELNMEASGTGEVGVPLGEENRGASDNFREASYVVLFIAAVFVINAMETGSYRTPWPVAIVFTLLGFGLLGYSLFHKPRTGQ